MRDAPSIALTVALQDPGAKVRAYDPVGMTQAKAVLDDVRYVDSAYACAEGADAVVIVTEWEQFRALDFTRLKERLKSPILVDLRNVYSADEASSQGFQYVSVGR